MFISDCMIKEVEIPENVKVEINDKKVKVSGEKGELEREFKTFFDIKIEKVDNKVKVSSDSERRKVKAMVGTIAAHIRNMIKGVTKGFTYKLKVVYSHFPITVKVEEDKVLIQNFLGEKVPRVAKRVEDVEIKVNGPEITLFGIDKEKVGLMANRLEQACRIKAKDRRVFQDGIWIVSKGD